MLRTIVFAGALCFAVFSAFADEISDSIDEAKTAYEAGDIAAAKNALDYASQLLAQKKAESMTTVLPEPRDGWQADKIESQAMGMAMFGGTGASRRYTKGDMDVEIQILSDSPMLPQMAMMMTNPQMAGAMGKLIKVGSRRAIQTSDDDIQLIIANRFLVMVEGQAPMAEKLAYAKAINYDALESMQ